jgi:hypothetical protein
MLARKGGLFFDTKGILRMVRPNKQTEIEKPKRGRPKSVKPKKRNVKTPSLTVGFYVIHLPTLKPWESLWDGAMFSSATAAVYDSKADADAALVSIKDEWDDARIDPEKIEIRPYSDFADTHYYFDVDGVLQMQVVPKGEGTTFLEAKRSARGELVKILKLEKLALHRLQMEYQKNRKAFLADIAMTEKQLARFDRNSERK